MTGGPSAHLTWLELACINRMRDRAGRPIAWHGIAPGAVVADYPLELRDTYGRRIGWVHEAIRTAVSHQVGQETPLVVHSAYRTPEYDKAVGGASSWHPKAGAIDYATPERLSAQDFYRLILRLASCEIADIGGVGLYAWGCHVDIRPRAAARVARWDYRSAGGPTARAAANV